MKAFHARWYRPENAAIIVAGDADPRLLAALIGKWFGDWPVVGPHTPTPSFGQPLPVPGADPANPVGPARVLVVPGMPRAITWTIERPWHEKNDTIVYNQGKMIDQLALAIINLNTNGVVDLSDLRFVVGPMLAIAMLQRDVLEEAAAPSG